MNGVTLTGTAAVTAAVLVLSIPHPASAARLPEHEPWQKGFRDYLSTLTADDFELADTLTVDGFEFGETEFALPADLEGLSADALYRLRIGLTVSQGTTSGARLLRVHPRYFTLTEIERGDRIRGFRDPEAVAWWVQFKLVGNPYYGSKPAKLRAMCWAASMIES